MTTRNASSPSLCSGRRLVQAIKSYRKTDSWEPHLVLCLSSWQIFCAWRVSRTLQCDMCKSREIPLLLSFRKLKAGNCLEMETKEATMWLCKMWLMDFSAAEFVGFFNIIDNFNGLQSRFGLFSQPGIFITTYHLGSEVVVRRRSDSRQRPRDKLGSTRAA